jgi:hypothetical protein
VLGVLPGDDAVKVVFLHSDKARERILADAFTEGVALAGDEVEKRAKSDEPALDADVVCMVGVKSRELFNTHWSRGIHVVYFDKGYSRHSLPGPLHAWEYWRVAVDAHQPTDKYRPDMPDDRLRKIGWTFEPWRGRGEHIVLAGSSAKYHEFYGLREPTAYWAKVVRQLQSNPRPIVYRPKPTWKEAIEIPGTRFSGGDESITDVLRGAHAVLTHGSNACFESVLAGVPVVSLGPSIARPISSTLLGEVEKPRLATDRERRAWLSFLAYSQYTLAEMASGLAWKTLRPQIYGAS